MHIVLTAESCCCGEELIWTCHSPIHSCPCILYSLTHVTVPVTSLDASKKVCSSLLVMYCMSTNILGILREFMLDRDVLHFSQSACKSSGIRSSQSTLLFMAFLRTIRSPRITSAMNPRGSYMLFMMDKIPLLVNGLISSKYW